MPLDDADDGCLAQRQQSAASRPTQGLIETDQAAIAPAASAAHTLCDMLMHGPVVVRNAMSVASRPMPIPARASTGARAIRSYFFVLMRPRASRLAPQPSQVEPPHIACSIDDGARRKGCSRPQPGHFTGLRDIAKSRRTMPAPTPPTRIPIVAPSMMFFLPLRRRWGATARASTGRTLRWTPVRRALIRWKHRGRFG